jgi:hypothetical protein
MNQHHLDASSTPHAPQGGTSLAQRKASKASSSGKSRKRDGPCVTDDGTSVTSFDDTDLLVRDNPAWDECWMELIPRNTFPLSVTEDLHHE